MNNAGTTEHIAGYTLKNCFIVYQGIAPQGPWDYFFTPSIAKSSEGSYVVKKVSELTGSFNIERDILARGVELYDPGTPGRIAHENIIEDLSELIVKNLAGSIAFMAIMAILLRLGSYFVLSVQKNINESDLKQWQKILLGMSVLATVELLWNARTLGWNLPEIFALNLISLAFSKVLPYSVSNFVRDIDFLCAHKSFDAKDFTKRNVLSFLRGLFFHLVLVAVIVYIQTGRFRKEQADDFYTEDGVQVGVCDRLPGHSQKATPFLKSYDFNSIVLGVLEEFGSSMGRIFIDLLIVYMHKIGKVQDLRNPCGFSREDFKLLGFKRIKGEEARQKKAKAIIADQVAAMKEADQQSKAPAPSASPSAPQDLVEGDSTNVFYLGQGSSTNKKADVVAGQQGHGKRKTRGKARRAGGACAAAAAAKPKATDRPSYTFTLASGQKMTFVRLVGRNYDQNLWGVLPAGVATRENEAQFQATLSSGHIGGSGIETFKGSTTHFHLRPGIDARVGGHLVSGKASAYDALKSHMSLEDAQRITAALEGLGQHGETLQLIVFNKYYSTHKAMGRALR